MELPIKTITIVVILALLLVIVTTFLFQSSGTSLTKAEAERIFSAQCQSYVQQGCEWDSTYAPDFSKYLNACRTLYGQERDSYSCLYTLCKGCFETNDIKCAGLCSICNGHQDVSIDRKTCCARFNAQCGTSLDCNACPTMP